MNRHRFRLRRIRKGWFLTFLLEKYGRWFVLELRRFFVPVILFIVILSTLIIVSTKDLTWDNWKNTQGFYSNVFCEDIRDGFIRQPFNAWSSLAFVLIGLWVARRASLDKVKAQHMPPVRRHARYGLIYGTALVLTGIGSWFFHASLTHVGHFVDVSGMYFLGGFLLTYGYSRKIRQKASAFLGVYAGLVLPLVVMQWFVPNASRYAFATLILAALAIEIIWHQSLSNKLFVASLITTGLAFGIWVLDEKRLLCWPESCIQGHALWHILTAVSTQLTYLYYRSETKSGFKADLAQRHRPGYYHG